MNFDLTDEQVFIRDAARELLAGRFSIGHTDPNLALWHEVSELGWPGIAIAEEHGGQGLGLIELVVLTEQLGYACAPMPFLGSSLAAIFVQEAGDDEQRAHWLPALATGETLAAFAVLDGPSELIPDAAPDRLLIAASRADGSAFVQHPQSVEPVEAIDSLRVHGLLRQHNAAAPTGERLHGDADRAFDRAAVVVAAELVGLCNRALETTLAYVKQRKQFGVPVGSFQAVQHSLAQMLRDTESASIATYYAAWAAEAQPDLLPAAAAMAKALASEAGRSVTSSAIQLHGGIGFTWEADLHWLFKRAQVDAAYLGGAGIHRARLTQLLTAQLAATS
jgi:alkylation response protein AidB-like acyl-CoA dehydrogenase